MQIMLMRCCFLYAIMLVVLCLPIAARSNDAQEIVVGNFSTAGEELKPPPEWKPLTFRKIERHTQYQLVRTDDMPVVRAKSDNSASGLVRKIRIDPKKHSILTWKWKVANILEKGDISLKKGDDVPARIYVTFEYDPEKVSLWEKVKYEAIRMFYGEYPPHSALNYVWGNVAEQGAAIPNAYTNRAIMIVVQSGKARLNQWIDETRNIYEDYKTAFQEEPPLISGFAIMTDSDNTGGSAVAYYGDMVIRKQNGTGAKQAVR